MSKLLESGIDRDGCHYTIKGNHKSCVLHCFDSMGTRLMITGSYEYVKQFV